MNTIKNIIRQTCLPLQVVGMFVFMFFMSACSNDIKEIQFFDPSNQPVQVVKKAHIVQSKGGDIQLKLDAPSIQKFDGEEPKTEYPDGVFVQFFNSQNEVSTSLSAEYAISYDAQNIMEARNNVVIIDYGSGDTTYMESIVWNKDEKRIYSNKPIKSVNGTRITYGDGFESDDKFKNPKIFNQRGTLEWNEGE